MDSERCVDLCFSDRYSLSVLDGEKIKLPKQTKSEQTNKKVFLRFIYYESNGMQLTPFCFLGWWYKERNKKIFLEKNYVIAKEKFKFDDIHVMDKFSNLILNLIDKPVFDKIDMYKNRLYVLDVKQKKLNIENVRGVNGTFFQKRPKIIEPISKFY